MSQCSPRLSRDGWRWISTEGREDWRNNGGEGLSSVDRAADAWWGDLECHASFHLEKADHRRHQPLSRAFRAMAVPCPTCRCWGYEADYRKFRRLVSPLEGAPVECDGQGRDVPG